MTAPRSEYCYEHSYKDLNKSSDGGRTLATQIKRNRIGQRAFRTWTSGLPLHALTSGQHTQHAVLFLNALIAQDYTRDDDHGLKLLRHFLNASPTVLRFVGGDPVSKLNYRELVDLLRDRLNPYLIFDHVMYQTVRDFESYFRSEQAAANGKRGKGHATERRVMKAIVLAYINPTQASIAKELGVQESTVSTWKKKYPAFREALANGRNDSSTT